MNAKRPEPRHATPGAPRARRAVPALRLQALLAAAALAAAAAAAGCGSSDGGSSTAATTASPSTVTSTLKVITRPAYPQPSPGQAAQSGAVQVLYRNIAVQPQTLRVRAGTAVRWTNADPIVHNVTSDGGPQAFASGSMPQGASFQVRFTRPGVVHYRCTIHPATMNGTIEVLP